MREILFRGKRSDGKWVYGSLDAYNSTITNEHGFCSVSSETVGQYTGLQDKNGVKIFEGDIIKTDQPYVVIFYDFGFTLRTKSGAYLRLGFISNNPDIKIIGNIHDNPKLFLGHIDREAL